MKRVFAWGPVTAALVFYVWQASVHLTAVIRSFFAVSDIAWLPMAAELSKRYGLDFSGRTDMHNSATTLLFDLAIRDLPQRWVIFQTAPLLLSVIGCGAIVWCVRQITADRWTVAVTAIVLYAQVAGVLIMTATQAAHGPSLFSAQALCAVLLFLHLRRPTGWARWAVVVLVGVVLGPNLGSDPALLVWGLGPLGVSALAHWWMRRDEPSTELLVNVVAIGAVMAVLAGITVAIFKTTGITFATGATRIQPTHPLTMARGWVRNAPLGLAGLLPALVLVVRWTRMERNATRDLFTVFWLAFLTLIPLAFIGTVANHDGYVRYVVTPAWVGVLTLLPVMTRPTVVWRAAVGLLLAAEVCVAAISLSASLVEGTPWNRLRHDAPAIAAALEAENATTGYAGYWDAASLGFATRARLEVFGVRDCKETLCQFEVNSLDVWYEPRPNTRSFLFIDTDPITRMVSEEPPAVLGPPAKVIRVRKFKIAIYDYDIASKIVKRQDPRWSLD